LILVLFVLVALRLRANLGFSCRQHLV